jgi:hypothetical protein
LDHPIVAFLSVPPRLRGPLIGFMVHPSRSGAADSGSKTRQTAKSNGPRAKRLSGARFTQKIE